MLNHNHETITYNEQDTEIPKYFAQKKEQTDWKPGDIVKVIVKKGTKSKAYYIKLNRFYHHDTRHQDDIPDNEKAPTNHGLKPCRFHWLVEWNVYSNNNKFFN